MIMSLNTGATAVVARARGRNEHDRANDILKQALAFSFFLSILSSIIGFTFAEPLIRLMAGSGMAESTVADGVSYLRIQMCGFFTLSLTLCITASLRGTGNSRVPMVYNMTSNLVNVFFNYLLINGNFGFPALGVAGASIATVIGQVVAMFMAFYSITCGKYYFKIKIIEKFRLDFKIIGAIAKVGIPALLEQCIMRVGMIIFSRQVSSLGEVDFATHNVCMNIQSLSFNNGQAFAVGRHYLGWTEPRQVARRLRRALQPPLPPSGSVCVPMPNARVRLLWQVHRHALQRRPLRPLTLDRVFDRRSHSTAHPVLAVCPGRLPARRGRHQGHRRHHVHYRAVPPADAGLPVHQRAAGRRHWRLDRHLLRPERPLPAGHVPLQLRQVEERSRQRLIPLLHKKYPLR